MVDDINANRLTEEKTLEKFPIGVNPENEPVSYLGLWGTPSSDGLSGRQISTSESNYTGAALRRTSLRMRSGEEVKEHSCKNEGRSATVKRIE